MELSDQHHAPVVLPYGKKSCTHCTGDWVGISFNLDCYGETDFHNIYLS
jgi:hypothetical protein